MNRSLIRNQYTAAMQPSRRIYSPGNEAVLARLRAHITVLELEGALFFGSADRLAVQAEALGAECRALVLDFKRVSVIDASGAVELAQTALRLKSRRVALHLAGVRPGSRHAQALREFAGATFTADLVHPDVDHAVEAAELALLAHAQGDAERSAELQGAAVALADCSLLAGLDEGQAQRLAALLVPRRLAAGERLFHEGEAGDCLYVLTEGAITVRSADAAGGVRQRYVTFSPGMMLGEMAMLDGAGRTADAVADTAATVLALSRSTLQALQADEPVLCAQVYRNMALHLAARLRAASAAWRASAL